ncbi:hypothetical protein HPB50_020181 [Hyalomma asiaticum]|uniref:Uncharacterized protein n=1 Tax=Hyalomma asiaticum TaxID=266040 RepID=A0ACB7TRV4_HYAAI|nr:hypothetical protein HPB50_020181 [Hyalomma asiaticum]
MAYGVRVQGSENQQIRNKNEEEKLRNGQWMAWRHRSASGHRRGVSDPFSENAACFERKRIRFRDAREKEPPRRVPLIHGRPGAVVCTPSPCMQVAGLLPAAAGTGGAAAGPGGCSAVVPEACAHTTWAASGKLSGIGRATCVPAISENEVYDPSSTSGGPSVVGRLRRRINPGASQGAGALLPDPDSGAPNDRARHNAALVQRGAAIIAPCGASRQRRQSKPRQPGEAS